MQKSIENFLKFLSEDKDFSDNTLAAYNNDLTQFRQFLQGEMLIVPKQAGGNGTQEIKSTAKRGRGKTSQGPDLTIVTNAYPNGRGRLAETSGLDSRNGGNQVDEWPQVGKEYVVSYMVYLKERKYADSTVARKIAAVKSFFHYLSDKKFIASDPTATLDSPRVSKYLPKAISVKDISALLEQPHTHKGPEGLRDASMLGLLYSTGMRVTELVSLNMDDVDLEAYKVRCVGKGTKSRLIPIRPDQQTDLTRYLLDARPLLVGNNGETALFVNHRGHRLTRQGFWLILKAYADQANIADITPHTLRHSFAAHMLDETHDVRRVQELLGHASVSTTQIYNQVNGSIKRVDPKRAFKLNGKEELINEVVPTKVAVGGTRRRRAN